MTSDKIFAGGGYRVIDERKVISEDNVHINNKYYTGAVGAYQLHPDGRPYHTFRTSTLLVDGNDVNFENCIFENTVGTGEKFGQAIALYLDGDRISLTDCEIRGFQDSLFLAPLPPKEYEKDGFLGPKQFTPRTMREYHFKRCRIMGSVDFIFGGAAAVFEECEFINVESGFVFAPCTPEGEKEGFTAINCRFTHTENVEKGSCYIARPWREFARVKLVDCYLDDHIAPKGWDDWGKTGARETVCFEEYGSYGPGADNASRPDWVRCG
ncbi:pectinesterase [Eubacterium ruminantium]|nr:pectinesterase [Eubacterium ruminantium]